MRRTGAGKIENDLRGKQRCFAIIHLARNIVAQRERERSSRVNLVETAPISRSRTKRAKSKSGVTHREFAGIPVRLPTDRSDESRRSSIGPGHSRTCDGRKAERHRDIGGGKRRSVRTCARARRKKARSRYRGIAVPRHATS